MHDSQKFEQPSDPTLSKLLEVEADLAAQAAALTAQLEDVQEKRRSLQTVIGMFASAVSPAESTGEVTTDDQPETSEEPQHFGSRRQSARVNKAHKTTGRSKGWQHYVRQEFAKLSLPEAVFSVLQRQSDQVLEVPTIVNSLFVDEIPQKVRSEARNRVSNVLSIGLKNNKWYRGKKGQYSSSREAAEANLAS